MLNLDRINELARKSREGTICEEEKEEQKVLRRAYIDSVVGGLKKQLECTYIIDEKGNKIKVEKKGK